MGILDYKKLIKSRNVRIRIMQALSFVPDQVMLKIQYRMKTGRRLNLKNPQRFTEKLQWYKLYYRDPAMKQCVDKYEVRSYIEEQGFGHTLNACYGVYDTPDKIDFENLPEQFVLKDTLGGGGNSVIIVHEKSKLNKASVMKQMQSWVNEPVKLKHPGREWVYDNRKHRILIEGFLNDEKKGELIDYKFFCFHGRVEFMYVMCGRKLGESVKVGLFDRDFNKLPVLRVGDPDLDIEIHKPDNYDEMVRTAEILARRYPHVRVDLYNIEGKIRFGELTFFNASGYMQYEPDEFDYEMGSKLRIGL